jgi:Ca-activated chloride channel family protein
MNLDHFHHSLMLIGLVLVPLVFGTWVWGTRRAAARARSVSRVSAGRPPYAVAALLALAASAAIVAAAQPRWGTEQSAIPRTGADLVVIIDISRSMDARDTPPSRLDAARQAVLATLDRLQGDRVGLVVFAGSANLRFPLTSDLAAARQVVSSLETGAVYVGAGTSASIGLDTARNAFDFSKPTGRAVLLLTDGDDLGSDPSESALRLKDAGVDLIVAGVGTTQGGTIPITDVRSGAVTDKTDDSGAPIVTRLNETFLRALAGAAGGRYVGSDTSLVPGIVQARLDSLASAVVDERETAIPIERYQWFAAGALALLLLASIVEYLGRRPRPLLFVGAALALVLLPGCASAAYSQNEAGRDALKAGDAQSAIDHFIKASAGNSGNAALNTNLAAAYYGAQRYDEAILTARRALTSNDPVARGRAYASVGHSQFAAGRLPDALDAFRHALLENPDDTASRHDYEVVAALVAKQTPPTPPGQQPTPGAPPPGDSGTPGGSATPPPSATPTAPGDGSGDGDGTPAPGATPGDAQPRTDKQIDQQLQAIDGQVAQLLQESGNNPDATQALQILQLLAERSRISGLRDPNAATSGPKDY